MKKIFTILFIFLNTVAFTQTYTPFPDSNAVWIISESCSDNPCNTNHFVRYEMQSDTLINGLVYKIISVTDSMHYINCVCSAWLVGGGGLLFIREDGNKKIWTYNPGTLSDDLLYDFNLNVGDTINNTILCAFYVQYAVVSSIDSILIGNGYRKRYFFHPSPWAVFDTCSCFLIEGIGNAGGLFEPICGRMCFEAGYNLECFKQNGNIEYFSACPMSNDSNYVCNTLLISSKNEIISNEKELIVFPNPTMEYVEINFNFQKSDQLIFSDALGKIYFTKKISSPTSNFKLQTSNFSNGIYFLEVKTKEGILNKKVMVQH